MWALDQVPVINFFLKSNYKAIGCSYNSYATTVAVDTFCLVGQYCNMQGFLLGMIMDGFSPMAGYAAPSNTI